MTARPWHLALVVMCLAGAASGPAQVLDPARAAEILNAALDACDQAAAAGLEQATPLYRSAIAGFESLRDAGMANAAIAFNLGNCYFRLGELGRAIANYRRALRLAPGDRRISANLDYARRRVEPTIRASATSETLRSALFWHYQTSLRQRWWAALATAVIGWGALALRLRWRRRSLAAFGVAAVFLSLVAGGSAWWSLREQTVRPAAVVVSGHMLRLGRGEGYDAALKESLGPGVEVTILQERGDWAEVRLADGSTGWLPCAALERVQADLSRPPGRLF